MPESYVQALEGLRTLNMSPVTLESLPTEILQVISEVLDITHPISLLAFARASKHCYAVASNVLFRTVKIRIADGKQPLQHVCELEERLLRDDAVGKVRRIILFSGPKEFRYPYLSLHPCERGREDDTALWRFLGKQKSEWPRNWHSTTGPLNDDEWKPLVRLVGQLTGLTNLFWSSYKQLPLCLLQVLQERLRPCRLHHSTFKPSSPIQSSLTPYDRTLITSPCLYSIGGRGISPSTLKLFRRLQSPGLRRSYLWWERLDAEIEARAHNTDSPKSVPREFIEVNGPSVSIPIPFAVIYNETSGDFSSMRTLNLNIPLAPQGLPAAADFPLLDTLNFTCCVSARSTPTPPEYWDEVTTLLHKLPELTTLQIQCWDRAISILPSLSPNLRKLNLSTWSAPGGARLRDDHIHQLAETCPNLQHLTLEVRRSRGDAAEVARYRSLGRLPRLQELYICLDVSPPGYIQAGPDGGSTTTSRDTAIEPWFDEQDARHLPWPFGGHREGHIRDIFINSAIDESLARSIFEVIDKARPRSSPGRTSPLSLERLELRARGGDEFPDRLHTGHSSILQRLLEGLKRVWRVERDVRDDSRGVLHVVNLAPDFMKTCLWLGQVIPAGMVGNPHEFMMEYCQSPRRNRYWFGLWRRVWTVEREGVHWWDEWESRPLDLSRGYRDCSLWLRGNHT